MLEAQELGAQVPSRPRTAAHAPRCYGAGAGEHSANVRDGGIRSTLAKAPFVAPSARNVVSEAPLDDFACTQSCRYDVARRAEGERAHTPLSPSPTLRRARLSPGHFG